MRDLVDRLVQLALEEDLGPAGDVTSEAIFGAHDLAKASFVAREALVVSGLDVAARVYAALDARVHFRPLCADGDARTSGQPLAEVAGPARALWSGERTALNFLQRLSGIATLTRDFVKALEGTRCRLLDTRKTAPGHRLLDQAAVRAGGGTNHRLGLFDGVLIKDNHVAAAGGLTEAVNRARGHAHGLLRIELEVDSLGQLEEALGLPVDIVLLDNMSIPDLKVAVERRALRRPALLLEASGGVRLETVRAIAETGVDFISAGVLTHGARAVDIGLDAIS
jgi:nicotinate-nucleotide pyrophosphorylase (carboxylating)